ncbi:MAG: methionine--tRNA ligase, partial [Planctomycetes bacterium]|nr:methionine--tRNA ligase [Planctomycetota bacterium]
FKRLDGFTVRFLTGTDEHGQKIAKAAEQAGVAPKEFVDRVSQKFRDMCDGLGLSEHYFMRTTYGYHARVVQAFFQRLRDKGLFVKRTYEGLYCVACEQGYSLSSLVDGKCPIHKTEPVKMNEENYFFKLSVFTDLMRQRLDDETRDRSKDVAGTIPNAMSLQPATKRNEILGKLREGLDDVSVTRKSVTWGVPVPGDESQVLYVWYDALINYVSSLMKDRVDETSTAAPDLDALIKADDFRNYWPTAVHLIGKEILWHHSAIWWSMLAGADIPMPHTVYTHNWWTVEGEKLSKTLGNAIDAVELAKRYSRDAVRFYILRDGPNRSDADWRHEQFVNRINTELAGELGNLLSRSLGMLEKYCAAVVPGAGSGNAGAKELEQIAKGLPNKLREAMDQFAFPQALDAIWELVRRANRYVDETQPFKLAKDPAKRAELETVMHSLLQTLRVLAHVLPPFLPDASEKMKAQLGIARETVGGLDEACCWSEAFRGVKTTKGEALFPRVEG